FKHALVQDTAYRTLLRGSRQTIHARIARALEGQSVVDAQPQILAHHYTEAGLLEEAIAYWGRAGQQSTAKSAPVEAIGQLRKGLALITKLPDSRERKRQELDLQIALVDALILSNGYAHPEIPPAFTRVHTLLSETETIGTVIHFSV